MIAYTGIETVSNLAEEARDPVRSIPRSISWVAIAVFAIYFTLPWIALSAMPVVHEGGHYVTQLGQAPPHGFKNDPVLGLVENLGLHGARASSIAKVYVGILAATILFIATNAGVIGASRITYSMSSYRQLPEVFRRLHPKLKTPWLALIVFGGDRPDDLPALRQGRLPRPHVRVRGDALVHDRARLGDRAARAARAGERARVARAAEPHGSAGSTGRCSRSSAGSAPALAWLVVVVQDAPTRYAGLAWLAAGFVFYVLYRRRLRLPLRATTRAPVPLGAGARARVPLDPRPDRQPAASRTRRSSSRRGSPPSGPAASCCSA